MDYSSNLEVLSHKAPKLADEIIASRDFLEVVTRAALNPLNTDILFAHFKLLFADICARWRSLPFHWTTLAAFGRVLPFAPYLAEHVEAHLQSEDPVSLGESYSTSLVEAEAREYLSGIFRLLLFDNDAFGRYVRPSAVQAFLAYPSSHVRYLAIRVLCLYVHAADAAMEATITKHFGEEPIIGEFEGKQVDYRHFGLREEQRHAEIWKSFKDIETACTSLSGPGLSTKLVNQDELSPFTAEVFGLFLPRSTKDAEDTQDFTPLAATTTTTKNIRKTAECLLRTEPILLTGLPGSGKTFIVKHLAQKLGKSQSMLILHLNEQSDAKILIGMYTSDATPGSFTWKPGVLTTAVREGRWIFIEDLDRAPNEIISTLLPLIERRELLIPARGETLKAARGFRIIATIRTTINSHGDESRAGANIIGCRFWQHVSIAMPPISEVQEIVFSLFSRLSAYIPRIMAVYHHLQAAFSQPSFAAESKTGKLKPLTLRDLLKWCRRVVSIVDERHAYTDDQLDDVFLEAVDCFAGSFQIGCARTYIISSIAEELHIDPQRRDYLLERLPPGRTVTKELVRIGRARIQRSRTLRYTVSSSTSPFAENGHAARLLERIAVAIQQKESVLLVGETGIGKTTVIQHLAMQSGRKLHAFNLSQQSESSDLIGGYKPVTIQSLVIPLKHIFDDLFGSMFSIKKNQRYLDMLSKCITKGQWSRVCTLWSEALRMVESHTKQSLASGFTEPPKKKQKVDSPSLGAGADRNQLIVQWQHFAADLKRLERHVATSSSAFAFSFVEGNLVKAVRNGDWILLDEINLAASDTLDSLADLLGGEGDTPFMMLSETGDAERIEAHPDFRIFAAMNPATDVGKKDLQPGIRSRFTEFFVESPDKDTKSLQAIVEAYLGSYASSDTALSAKTTSLYQNIQRISNENRLVDGANQKPHYSLRSLTRTLNFARDIGPLCGIHRALYEGFHMSFSTVLDKESNSIISPLIAEIFPRSSNIKAELKKPWKRLQDGREYVKESNYWLRRGNFDMEKQEHYIITPFVRQNLDNLIRATFTRRFPVLLQGPTSSGKTSMIEYLAKKSGNKFVRINNHEHTDLQEYLGTYVSDANGRLHFQEGVLVRALREGHWIVLDELNLAPTDVLEALNRLLDDNRELFIPETQEIVRPHEDFMLFATQNPAGLYGGRKILSKAFRNRFLELHFDDIPVDELKEILRQRTQIPPSWSTHIVNVYKELSILRQQNRLFDSKSFATLRDLFRWALRGASTAEELAAHGFMLLAERVRNPEERDAVKQVIEKVISTRGPKISISEDQIYGMGYSGKIQLYKERVIGERSSVIWNKAMRRLFVLVANAVRHNEPVLLIGETGCGKTTVCQMLADSFDKQLYTVNAHQNTESGDLIGAQRPVRNRLGLESQLRVDVSAALDAVNYCQTNVDNSLETMLTSYDDLLAKQGTTAIPETLQDRIQTNRRTVKALFEWVDGSLVEAMKTGQFFLLDEISLADDAVLERLNSVLEPQRSLLLAEKGPVDSLVVGSDGFQFMATMNPGGDYGKRELSAALRNRFTEIWVPALSDTEDVLQIVEAKLIPSAKEYAPALVSFAEWFGSRYNSSAAFSISLRNLLAWVDFINRLGVSDPKFGIAHGAATVYIDTLGANPSGLLTTSSGSLENERQACLNELEQLVNLDLTKIYTFDVRITTIDFSLHIGPFSIPLAGSPEMDTDFTFLAPTTKTNAMRVVRALQCPKPILIEGNPGVGKTTLVTALAKSIGKPLTRINLSEQTDLTDLFGTDVPVEDAATGTFAWRDAPFLRAMKQGDWVLLDEMNLASQSVLEGLNACLDHRGEIYVSELDRRFHRHPDFRLFAAQNPHHQGGGRKGLPASFIDRFTVVYADTFRFEDLMIICRQAFPGVPDEDLRRVSNFVNELDTQVVQHRRFGSHGGPWEFNLRDTLRWLQLIISGDRLLGAGGSFEFLDTLFTLRFRNAMDRASIHKIYSSCFLNTNLHRNYYHNMSQETYQVGLGLVSRRTKVNSMPTSPLSPVPITQLPIMESLMICVQQNWPVILAGPAASGKTSLLKQLAASVGADVFTFSMNAEIDAMDLVGTYEQADPLRLLHRFVSAVKYKTQQLLVQQLHDRDHSSSASMNMRLLEIVRDFSTSAWSRGKVSQLQRAAHELSNLSHTNEMTAFSVQINKLAEASLDLPKGRFEWIDGILVQAMEQGKWLVLDNANLCSSSVLDRLNSLLEPNGVLLVNEHPGRDNEPKVVKPHPGFRIFLSVDPKYGELSRAMRNRAVELYLLPQQGNGEVSLSPLFPFESSLYRLRNFVEVLSNSQSNSQQGDQLTSVALSHLSMSDDRALRSSKESRMSQETLLSSFFLPTSFIPHPSYLRSISSFYSQSSRSVNSAPCFSAAQAIIPTINEPLVNQNDTVRQSAISISSLYDIFCNLASIESVFKSTISANSQQPNGSRLSRSIAAARLPGASTDSTYGIHGLLAILEATKETLVKCLQNPRTERSATLWIKTILRLWWNIFQAVSSQDFDEARFQALLTIGRSKAVLPVGIDSVDGLSEVVRKNIAVLQAPTTLTTGRAMELLWRAFKPSRSAASNEALQALLKLETSADELDRALMTDRNMSFSDIVKVRNSFAKAFTLVLGEQTVDFDMLHSSLEKLPEMSSDLSTEPDIPFFSDEFETLCQIQNLYRKTPQSIPPFFAGRVTRCIWESQELTKLEALNAYLGYCRPQRPAAFALRGNLPLSLIRKTSQHITEVPLKEFGRLQFETNIMGQLLARNTVSLCKNQLQSLDELLVSLIRTVMRALGAPQDIDIYALARRSSAKIGDFVRSDIPWRDIFNNQFRDVFDYFGVETHSNHSEAASNAWIQFGVGSLLLYVPDKPYDPALRPIIERELWQRSMDDLKKQLAALRTFEVGFTGASTSMRIRLLEEEIALQGSEPAVPAVIRPARSELTTLQGDFTSVLALVRSLLSRSIGAGLEPTIQQNLLQLIQRLSEGYRSYNDLTTPVVGFLQCVQVGVLLSKQENRFSAEGSSYVSRILSTTPFLAGTPNCSAIALQTTEIGVPSILMHTLELLAIYRSVEGSLPGNYQLTVSHCFRRFFNEWKAHLKSDQQKATAMSNLYRYRGGDDEDDGFDQKEFDEMFPNYEASDEPNLIEKKSYDPQITAKQLADVHKALFLGPPDRTLGLRSLLMKASERISRVSAETSPLNMIKAFPILFVLLSEQKDLLETNSAPSSYSFYTDANVLEAKKFITLVNHTQRRFAQIHKAWPEQATPIEVLQLCKETLAFRHVEPVAKFLTKAEKLHATINEWQVIASREWNAEPIYTDLTNLIVSWRQLELSTWARMLDAENVKAAEDGKAWWFVAYECLIFNPTSLVESDDEDLDMGAHAQELLGVLEGFVVNTTIGQYEARIQMLRQFQAHLGFLAVSEPELEPVRDALTNLVNYFGLFIGPVQRIVAERREPLEQHIRDEIKLISWKDRNVHALRESSKASHHKLFKVVRKYRGVLNDPVEGVIRAGLPDESRNLVSLCQISATGDTTTVASIDDISAISICESKVAGLPTRYRNVPSTVSMMRGKGTAEGIFDVAAYLDSFTFDVEASIVQFRKATPARLTEDTKKTIGHLKNQKRRFFADVLKAVRQMGFKSSLSTDILVEQDSRHKVLSSIPPLPTDSEPTKHPSYIYFLKLLEVMPKVREAMRDHSEDITSAEIIRSTAYLESMLGATMRQREAIAESLQDHAAITRICDQAAVLWNDGSCAVERYQVSHTVSYGFSQAVRWLPSIIDMGIAVILAQEKLGTLDFSEIRRDLIDWRSKFLEISSAVEAAPSAPQHLRTASAVEIEHRAETSLERFKDFLTGLFRDRPQIAFLSDHIMPWTTLTGNLLSSDMRSNDDLGPGPTIERTTDLADDILASVQDLEKALESVPSSTEDIQWLMKSEDALENCISSLNAAILVPKWQQLLHSLHKLEPNDLQRLSALITVLLPILQQYRQIYQEQVERFVVFHTATCKTSYVLAKSFVQIATQGLCGPSEKSSGQADHKEKIEDGTGLGDGDAMEDAEDISKDLNEDESLEELVKQPNDETNREEIDDEKDAVDMADEMEGKSEQVEGSADEDQEDADKGSQEDADSEIGSVDDLGASAVDEKMWDEAAERDAKDRKADDKGLGSKEKDVQVAGKEQQNDDSESGEDMDDVTGEDAEAPDSRQPEESELQHPDLEEKLDLPEDLHIGQNGDDDEQLSSNSEIGTDLGDQQEVEQPNEEMIDPERDLEQDRDSPDQDHASSLEDEDNKREVKEDTPDSHERAESEDPSSEQQTIPHNEENSAAPEDVAQSEEAGNNGARIESQAQEGTATESGGQEGSDGTDNQTIASGPDGPLGQTAQRNSLSQPFDPQETSHEEEPFKKLGDALERWYRQQKAIHDSQKETHENTQEPSDQDVEMADAEYQHLQENEEMPNTQALGTTTKEEATAVDLNQAIDALQHDNPQERAFDEQEDEAMDFREERDEDIVEGSQSKDDHDSPLESRAFVGERKESGLESTEDETMHDEHEREDQPQSHSTLVEFNLSQSQSGRPSLEQARALWSHHENATRTLSLTLTEHLRLILTPTQATKMRGDFRTGKRLNLKRIIPYIASEYKRDKIWMRRSVPSKRAYQIMLAIDDSSSMAESGGGQLALATVALISRALSILEAGELAVVAFGENVEIAHGFETPFAGDAGAEVFKHFGFKQGKTDVRLLLQESLTLFQEARLRTSSSSADLWQLQIIISDGVCDDHPGIKRLVRQAQEERVMIVFVIVDAVTEGKKQSIMELQEADFGPDEKGEMKVKMRKYLDTFPFQYYLIVRDVGELPGVLAGALRQWFAEVVDTGT